MSRLVRKQVYLTEEQDALLKRVANRERRTEADIIRAALSRELGLKPSQTGTPDKDPLWDIVGLGRSEAADVSENVDTYLYGHPEDS